MILNFIFTYCIILFDEIIEDPIDKSDFPLESHVMNR